MIWEATSISGWRIVGIRTIKVHRSTAPRGSRRIAPRMSYDLDLGRTTQTMFDLQVAIDMIPACVIQPTACALLPHHRKTSHARRATGWNRDGVAFVGHA